MPWKGAGTLHGAAALLGEKYLVVFVGSKPHHVAYFKSLYPERSNVQYEGHQPHSRIPLYLRAADVLVLPNSALVEVSRISTSPMKLFEYMASGTPIVASDIPSIREVLDEKLAVLVSADDVSALSEGIQKLFLTPGLGQDISRAAQEYASQHTWDARAKGILAAIV